MTNTWKAILVYFASWDISTSKGECTSARRLDIHLRRKGVTTFIQSQRELIIASRHFKFISKSYCFYAPNLSCIFQLLSIFFRYSIWSYPSMKILQSLPVASRIISKHNPVWHVRVFMIEGEYRVWTPKLNSLGLNCSSDTYLLCNLGKVT